MPNSLLPIDLSKPQSNELEISIFGSHVGECIVVHIRDGRWMIVDSCRNPSDKKPIALSYLASIGVDVSRDVELIIITHWHDDHIQGVSTLVEACHSARVCFSSAMLKQEFLVLLSSYSAEDSLVDRYTAGTREMADTIKILKNRATVAGSKSGILSPIVADRILYEAKGYTIRSLSPSDKSVHKAIACFASLLPAPKSERKTIPAPTQNDNSIVLWLSCLDQTVLLGADLEETNDEETGWRAVISSPVKPDGKARLFKIPHHGSKTGHSEDVWKHMVEKEAICLLTGNSKGKYSLPTHKDIERIKENTSKLFCTSSPKHKLAKRDSTVERTLRGMVKNRKSLGGASGQVQVRIPANGIARIGIQAPAKIL